MAEIGPVTPPPSSPAIRPHRTPPGERDRRHQPPPKDDEDTPPQADDEPADEVTSGDGEQDDGAPHIDVYV